MVIIECGYQGPHGEVMGGMWTWVTFKRNYALEGDPGKGTPAGCQVDVWPKAQQSLAQELEIFSLKGLMVTT